MIRHVVTWKLKENAGGKNKKENMKLVKEQLIQLMGKVPHIKELKVYLNSEEAPEGNFDVVLDSAFDDFKGLSDYMVHPEHEKVAEFIKSVVDSRVAVDAEY